MDVLKFERAPPLSKVFHVVSLRLEDKYTKRIVELPVKFEVNTAPSEFKTPLHEALDTLLEKIYSPESPPNAA
jgi:hypothetical protein